MNQINDSIEGVKKNIKYLYNLITIPFSDRVGIKNICRCFTNNPITKEDIRKVKEVFEELNLKPYKSGEYPVPLNLEKFRYLNYVTYSDDFTSFKVMDLDENINMNRIELIFYKEAQEKYSKYYKTEKIEELENE